MGALDDDVLAQRAEAAYLLCNSSLTVNRVDGAFDGFAAASCGTDDIIGTPILSLVPAPLRDFHGELFRMARSLELPLRHDYQFSSLRERRWFSQYIVPHSDALGVYLVLAASQEREGPGPLDDWSCMVGEDGFATQCIHCRRMADVNTGEWKLTRECYDRDHRAPAIREVLCSMCDGYFSDGARVATSAADFLLEGDRFSPAAVTLIESRWSEIER